MESALYPIHALMRHLQPERIYRCRSISVGSSNFFQHLRIFGTLDR